MAKLHDLEDQIMKCWQLVNDIEDIGEHILNDSGSVDADTVSNMLIGLSGLYNIRFTNLFNAYEDLLKQNAN